MAVLGCIADDFTGASDAASFLVKGGMSVQLYNGVPAQAPDAENSAQALVIALKSRTQKTEEAVADSVAAAKFLLECGVKQIYFKYCSTFDSTPDGNIGPVADALMELTGARCTILCPALPVNGRTVENGCLMVNGVHLHHSHMKDHPLTPMWDSRIATLMAPQTKYACLEIGTEMSVPETDAPVYLIPDYKNPEDGQTIAEAFWQLPLLTGGSGLLEPLARIWTKELGNAGGMPESATQGGALLLAGSCSKATLGQIAWYQAQGKPTYKLNPMEMLSGEQNSMLTWQPCATNDEVYNTLFNGMLETLEMYKARGVIASISVALADMRVSITSINTQMNKDGTMLVSLSIGCKNTAHYESIVSRLRSLKSVLSVSRGFSN